MAERSAQLTVHSSQFTENEDVSRLYYKPVEWSIPEEFKKIMGYNPQHDIQDFLDLADLHGKIPPEEFTQRQIQTINRTKRQLAKALGERFKVRSSQVEYSIENGILKSPDYPEPVIERYEKGRKFLAQNGSMETKRESAEVKGIRQIQTIFFGEKIQDGDKIIIISPRGPEGTLYMDNLFYVYEQINGKITMTRYHSTHDYQRFFEATQTLDPAFDQPQPDELNAAYFLQKLIITNKPTDHILKIFALDLDTQLEKTNQEIIEACNPYFDYYIRILVEDPLNFEEIKKTINTIYNVADETKKRLDGRSRTSTAKVSNVPHFTTIEQTINFYGLQPVRSVSLGCPGGQKGFSLNQPSFLRNLSFSMRASSVIDFAPFALEDEDKSDFQCPGTKKDGSPCTYIVRYGSGIRKCPECGMDATCG